MAAKSEFKKVDFVVYPTHGVGKITGVETQEIAGQSMKLFVIEFDKEKMTLRVPVVKADTSGLRRLSTRKIMDNAMKTLKGRSRVKRTKKCMTRAEWAELHDQTEREMHDLGGYQQVGGNQ